MTTAELPIPHHFTPDQVEKVWKVLHQDCAEHAEIWANTHYIKPAAHLTV